MVVDGEQGNYFGVVSTYIHLNLARAGLIKIGKEPLSQYGWSSHPCYLESQRRPPRWLATERVMGDVGLKAHEARGYDAYLEERVLGLGIKAGRTELTRRGRQFDGDGIWEGRGLTGS